MFMTLFFDVKPCHATIENEVSPVRRASRERPLLERLAGLASSSLHSPMSEWLTSHDLVHLVGSLLMRHDIFVSDGKDLVEALRLQLGLSRRVDAARHFVKNNKPEIDEVLGDLDLFQVITHLGLSKKYLIVMMHPLRELLEDYTDKRARFPFYDYLPPGLRREYLRYFTPVSNFQVFPGVDGILAYLPRCYSNYSNINGEDQYVYGDLIVLDGIGDTSSRIVNVKDGRSADLNNKFTDISFFMDTREVLVSDESGVYKWNDTRFVPCNYQGYAWNASSIWHGYPSRSGETAVLNQVAYMIISNMDDILGDWMEELEVLRALVDLTPQQVALLQYFDHADKQEISKLLGILPLLGMNMTILTAAPEFYNSIDVYSYTAMSLKEIIKDGKVTGRLSQVL